MTGERPVATVETDPKPMLFSPPRMAAVAVLAVIATEYFALRMVGSLLGTPPGQYFWPVFAVVYVAIEAAIYTYYSRGAATFYPDHVAFDGRELAYDDVSVVVKSTAFPQDMLDNADFEFVAHGAMNVSLDYAADPATVERVVSEHVPAPAEQTSRDAGDTGPTTAPIDQHGDEDPQHLWEREDLWHYWPDEEPKPEGPVVDIEDLETGFDVGLGVGDLDQLDDVAMHDADDLTDIDHDDLDSGDGFEASDMPADAGAEHDGFDDGGFDGGDGGDGGE